MKTLQKAPFILMIPFSVLTSQTQFRDTLALEIKKEFQSVPGIFAIAVKDLSTGKSLCINERERFHAASTMKTPVMIEAFKQASEGRFQVGDSILVKNEFKSIVDSSVYSLDLADDSDDSMYKKVGSKSTVRELVYQMITVSSNLATNLLIELVGAKRVMETMRALGAHDIQVLRGVEDGKAFERGMNNTTTAYDLLMIFDAIARGRIVNSGACEEMLSILSKQRFREKIPALLPEGTRVAHKTGNITGVEHDSGIVFLPDGRRYVIVLLSKDLKDAKSGQQVLARVSRKVYDFLAGRNEF